MADPELGTVLGGKFVIEGVLGRGGMGVVYAARHQELDQRVAIKCLLPQALEIPEVIERFAREARAAAKIQGEHVARVIDVGRFDDGTPYIVMEHLEGHDLSQELLARGRLPVEEAVRHVLETCEALAQAHAFRIVHRDLKPANLFLAQSPGRPPIIKVLDFGISKVVGPDGGSLTRTATIMGTPSYMSPEQLLASKSVDARSDIWALGVILYELLSGQLPFTAETAPEVIALIVQNTPQAIREHRADVPPGLEAVVQRCLRSRPDERYPHVAELAVALSPFAAVGDRDSVVAIARVLGVSENPIDSLPGPASVVNVAAPTLPAQPLASLSEARLPVTGNSATEASLSVSSPSVSPRVSDVARTAGVGGVAASPRGRALPAIGIGVLLTAIGAGVLYMSRLPSGPGVPPTGFAVPATATPAIPRLTTPDTTPSTVAATAEPVDTAPPAASASAPPAPSVDVAPASAQPSSPPDRPSPSATAPHATTQSTKPAKPSTPAAPRRPPVSTKDPNPLDLHLK